MAIVVTICINVEMVINHFIKRKKEEGIKKKRKVTRKGHSFHVVVKNVEVDEFFAIFLIFFCEMRWRFQLLKIFEISFSRYPIYWGTLIF